MADNARLQALIEPVVRAAGFELVRVAMPGGNPPTLQVMAEDPATGQMTLDDCARLSRALSAMLDAADPIPHAYTLEVSSPGIDRPLTRLKDYARWAGHRAKIELAHAIELAGATRRRLDGELRGAEGETIRIDVSGLGVIALPLAAIASAKLALTDRLIAETAPLLSAEGADEIEDETDADAAAGLQDNMRTGLA